MAHPGTHPTRVGKERAFGDVECSGSVRGPSWLRRWLGVLCTSLTSKLAALFEGGRGDALPAAPLLVLGSPLAGRVDVGAASVPSVAALLLLSLCGVSLVPGLGRAAPAA